MIEILSPIAEIPNLEIWKDWMEVLRYSCSTYFLNNIFELEMGDIFQFYGKKNYELRIDEDLCSKIFNLNFQMYKNSLCRFDIIHIRNKKILENYKNASMNQVLIFISETDNYSTSGLSWASAAYGSISRYQAPGNVWYNENKRDIVDIEAQPLAYIRPYFTIFKYDKKARGVKD